MYVRRVIIVLRAVHRRCSVLEARTQRLEVYHHLASVRYVFQDTIVPVSRRCKPFASVPMGISVLREPSILAMYRRWYVLEGRRVLWAASNLVPARQAAIKTTRVNLCARYVRQASTASATRHILHLVLKAAIVLRELASAVSSYVRTVPMARNRT